MIYCMSDIHGEIDRFHKMLELISFSEEDELYVIGDVIDRNPGGVDILREIMSAANIHLIMGNHEQMMLDTLWRQKPFAKSLWHSNGGSCTYRELIYCTDPHEKIQILKFVSGLPDEMELSVGGRAFYLVHGSPAGSHEDKIWERPFPGTTDLLEPIPGETVIVGHTPTPHFMQLNDNEPFRIWHGNGIIDIDCGCGNITERRRLACLRLDDMREYYA